MIDSIDLSSAGMIFRIDLASHSVRFMDICSVTYLDTALNDTVKKVFLIT